MNCPHCQTPAGAPDWKARKYILWANQHGRKVRLFCKVCGAWTDFTLRYGSDRTSDTETMTMVKMPQVMTEQER